MQIQKVSVYNNQRNNQVQKQNNSQPAFGAMPSELLKQKITSKIEHNDFFRLPGITKILSDFFKREDQFTFIDKYPLVVLSHPNYKYPLFFGDDANHVAEEVLELAQKSEVELHKMMATNDKTIEEKIAKEIKEKKENEIKEERLQKIKAQKAIKLANEIAAAKKALGF